VAGEPLTMQDLAKQAQEVRQRLEFARVELAETEVTGTAGGGLVTVTIRGDGEVTRVAFDQAVFEECDAESLAALTFAAIRHATDEIRSVTTEKMAAVSAGLDAALGNQSGQLGRF